MKYYIFSNDLTKRILLAMLIMSLLLLFLSDNNSLIKNSLIETSLIKNSWAQDNSAQNSPNWYDIIKKGNMDALQTLLERDNYPLDSADDKGRILLLIAVEQRQEYIVSYLLQQGADVNEVSRGRQTALHAASYSNNITAVQLLLKYGANPNLPNVAGETPLYSAAFFGYTDIVILLLKNGGDIDIKNNNGDSPLRYAPETVKQAVAQYQGKPYQQVQNQLLTGVIAGDTIGNVDLSGTQNQDVQTIKKKERAQKIIEKLIAHDSYQRAQLRQNRQWIENLSSGKSRYRKLLHQNFTEEFIENGRGGLISKNNTPFAFRVIINRLNMPEPSLLAGFVPTVKTVPETGNMIKLATKTAETGMDYFRNLYDWLVRDSLLLGEFTDEELPLLVKFITSLTQEEVRRLQANRGNNLTFYRGLFFYDALLLMVKDADLQEIIYDKDTRNLTMVMRFNSGLISQSFVIENVAPDIYRNLRIQQNNIDWQMRAVIDNEGITFEELKFTTADVTVTANVL
ncbi:MAG: ankyrin repeat domain-containing protein [Alphaproteobacteria bacterium]|nr:ankyrin repeat domain-containing protein [Alphaproteobacteria bacterium]